MKACLLYILPPIHGCQMSCCYYSFLTTLKWILSLKKNHICFEYTPRRRPYSHIPGSLPLYSCGSWHISNLGRLLLYQSFPDCLCITVVTFNRKMFFSPGDLDLWPMTLTFELDLHDHTHTLTDDAKTITPVADAGCNNHNRGWDNLLDRTYQIYWALFWVQLIQPGWVRIHWFDLTW